MDVECCVFCVKDEEDVYGEEARGEDDADDDDDEGQEAEVVATLRANVLLVRFTFHTAYNTLFCTKYFASINL